MEILVFLCIISHLNLVLTDENVAIDPAVTHKNTYKVHPDPKDLEPQDDQIAESSQPITQSYGHGVVSNGQKEIEGVTQNHIQVAVGQLAHDGQNVHQVGQTHQLHLQEGLRHEDLQSVLNQGFTHQPQQIYVHQYPIQPIRILDAEASSLHQGHENENEKALGFSSYVEHVSHKDEEEINSALKEGSVSDIKRLVPKSEISFKIYKNEKDVAVENQKPEIQTNLVTHTQQKVTGGYSQQSQESHQSQQTHQSKLHHRIKTEIPVTQIKAAFSELPTAGLVPQLGLQQTYLKTEAGGQQHAFENSQQLLQSTGKPYSHDQQSATGQTVYYTQPEVNSQKSFLGLSGKSSSVVNPHFHINVADTNYNKATSTVQLHTISASKGSKQNLADATNQHYQKQWNFDSKAEGSQKAVKNVKPPSTLHYEVDPAAQTEKIRTVHYTQTHPVSAVSHVSQTFNKQKINSFGETNTKSGANFLSNSHVTKGTQHNFAGHFPNKAHSDPKGAHVFNRLSGNYVNAETLKTGHNHIVSHLGTTAYGSSQSIKNNQPQHFAIHSYSDSEPAKSEHSFISHVAQNSYVDTKTGQNNFDHQKALEGSTSFDIKNAIDSSGNLVHQTHYVKPTTEGHSFEDLHKQQLSYVIPKLPAVLIENSIHESPVVEAHQIKDFGHAGISSPQLSYHAVSSPDVSGKFFHQPIVWTSEHLKQGNTLTANDLQHSVIRVHLPKEEIYQHIKPSNLPLPTSSVSHISYQQKQPYVIHYDMPVVKYPQEIHFPPKTKFRIQNNQASHIKLSHPVSVDWSLFKSTLPNIQTLAVKPELTAHIQESGKKIVPILVRKRKNRSNSKQEVGVVYGKVNNNRRPTLPTTRHEKNVRLNLLPDASNNANQFESKGDRKNEFSVSASYKVDRSFKSPDSS